MFDVIGLERLKIRSDGLLIYGIYYFVQIIKAKLWCLQLHWTLESVDAVSGMLEISMITQKKYWTSLVRTQIRKELLNSMLSTNKKCHVKRFFILIASLKRNWITAQVKLISYERISFRPSKQASATISLFPSKA